MLFGVVYTPRDWSEASAKRSLQLFTSWQPPVEFKGHWAFATGAGMALIESDDAAAVVEAIAPFTAFFDFKCEPVVTIEEAVPIFMKTNEWRDGVA